MRTLLSAHVDCLFTHSMSMVEAQMLPWDGQVPLAHLLHLQLRCSMNANVVRSELYVNAANEIGAICSFQDNPKGRFSKLCLYFSVPRPILKRILRLKREIYNI